MDRERKKYIGMWLIYFVVMVLFAILFYFVFEPSVAFGMIIAGGIVTVQQLIPLLRKSPEQYEVQKKKEMQKHDERSRMIAHRACVIVMLFAFVFSTVCMAIGYKLDNKPMTVAFLVEIILLTVVFFAADYWYGRKL